MPKNHKTLNDNSILSLINLIKLALDGKSDAASAILSISQTLTEEQKAQARTNIGAVSVDDIPDMDTIELITVEDIDTICGSEIQLASDVMF